MKRNCCFYLLVAFFVASLGFPPAPIEAQQQNGDQSSGQSPAQSPAPISIPPPPDAQQQTPPSAQPVLRSSSDLVRIDVEVTGRDGKPLKGLKPEQFTVTDDGQDQKVSIFSYEDIEAIETAPDADTAPIVLAVDTPSDAVGQQEGEQARNRRLLVLFFDLTSLGNDDLIRAHDAAVKFVNQQMTHADLVSVVSFSSNLRVLADFTNDHDKLNNAIAQLLPGVSNQLANPLYGAAQNGEYDMQQDTGAAYTADETEFNVFNTDQKLEAIEGLSNVLGVIPGRKSVIEFTGGITQTGEENRTQLRAATDAANRANVSIYSIDSRGLMAAVPGGDVTSDASSGTSMFTGSSVFHQTDQREDSRDTLATLATDTGGKAFFDLGDLSDALPKIQQDNGGYYLVGYYLNANVKHDGSWHAVRVKVNAPGVKVRYRAGYYAPRDFQHLEKESRDQQLADAIHSDNPVVELPIAVETAMFRLSDEQVYVPISAKISSTALDWAEKHGRRQAEFDFAAEVRAASNGQIVAQLRDTINVQLDQQRFAQLHQSNLVYQGGVVLAPGSYHLKFVARENESGKIGTFEQNFSAPQRPPQRLSLSSVLLSSQLVPVEKSSEVQTKTQGLRAKLTTSPLEMDGQRIVPSVTRFFTQQQNLYVFFQAYYPEKGGNFDANALRAGLIFFRNGVQVNTTPMLAPTAVDEKTHTASFRITLPLAKLPPGRYTVQAIVIGAGTQQSAFGRAYLALAEPPAPPAGASGPAPSDGASQQKPQTP
ncbi:MAG TPA: VWA domain-containing protein [Candidatus Acidoferrales bacterium]|nr:VWA domain-containing protein [Candidatus Acidoferrales bacterium]